MPQQNYEKTSVFNVGNTGVWTKKLALQLEKQNLTDAIGKWDINLK